MAALGDAASGTRPRGGASTRRALLGGLLACVLAVTALTSEAEDWQPVTAVIALGALMVMAETFSIVTRSVRMSAGLMVQTTMMAVLGPAPAVAAGVVAIGVDSRVNRVRLDGALVNLIVYAVIGLVGGVAFDVLRSAFGLDRHDTAVALLALPVYIALMLLNLGLVATTVPGLSKEARRRVFRESGTPMIPLELLSAVTTATAVLAWAHFGLAAVVGLLAVLVVTIALARMLGSALKTGDDLVALRDVSDQRAAEVARLSSDRDRLLSEVLDAEQRERARLAESLHDGPMQRLVALRQDLGETDDQGALARPLEAAIAETRAIISAYHPATVRQLGFEASLRAAVAPFPAARTTRLTVRGDTDDPLLLPLAQELVVNAVKHARPTAIDVVVERSEGRTVLEVNDDGVGMDAVSGRNVEAGHLGLAMVRTRVEDAGGTLDIATRADGGTRSRVVLPTAPETRKAPG